MEFENILVEHPKPGVVLVRLNRPQVLNALNQAVMDDLVEAFAEFDADRHIRTVVLYGSEKAFAAGADVKEMVDKSPTDMLDGYRFNQWQRLREFSKPIIAAISGLALGGGLELAMLCDIIVASEDARLGQPEINLGLMPGAGGTQKLARTVGKSLAMEMVLNARLISANEALQAGLISRVVPKELCLSEALELASEIAARAPIAVRLAKQALLKAFNTTLPAGLESERNNFYLLFSTEDVREGINAFLERREPNWKGK